jgi:CheY-like chemotaxis protein
VRVVIADDTALLRQGLARLLAEADVEVAGEAADAAGLLALVERERPDAALVDIRMPPTQTDEGLVAAAAIRERFPETAVLVLSQYVEASYALRLLDRSERACGYLLKDRVTDAGELVGCPRERRRTGACTRSSHTCGRDPHKIASWRARSPSSPASGPTCRWRTSPRRPRAGASTASSSPAGETTSRSTARSPSPTT